MRPDELSRSVDTLVSAAGEGSLLAEGVADDRTKTTFVRVRARELGEELDHESEKLADATTDSELAAEKRAAVALADRIATQIDQLQITPTDEAAAEQVERSLGRLASECEQLQESL